MRLVSIAPVSIAAGDFHPPLELIGDTAAALTDRRRRGARRSRSPSSSRMDCRRCYSLPAAMGAKLALADRPVLCTMGDGGVGRIPFVTVVYNDNPLRPDSSGARRGYVDYGVRYGAIDFAAVSAALGAWSRRVTTLDELSAAVKEARARRARGHRSADRSRRVPRARRPAPSAPHSQSPLIPESPSL
jgi:thiamine pyrophosphate-dependent acetolactate synthase large subunit-like protein